MSLLPSTHTHVSPYNRPGDVRCFDSAEEQAAYGNGSLPQNFPVDPTNALLDADDVAEVATAEQADAFGQRVAQELVGKGAQKILDVINAEREATRDDAKPWIPA